MEQSVAVWRSFPASSLSTPTRPIFPDQCKRRRSPHRGYPGISWNLEVHAPFGRALDGARFMLGGAGARATHPWTARATKKAASHG